jgi:hypothetical protein
MKSFSFLSAFVLMGLLSGCALVQPYSITFTTPAQTSIDPASDTLDLVVTPAAFAAISSFKCGNETADIFMSVPEDALPQSAYNLSLEMLSEQASGTECEVTVSAFDKSTNSSSKASLNLTILTPLTPEVSEIIEEPAPAPNLSPDDTDATPDTTTPELDSAPATEEPAA